MHVMPASMPFNHPTKINVDCQCPYIHSNQLDINSRYVQPGFYFRFARAFRRNGDDLSVAVDGDEHGG